jgi:hypothetical protein
VGSLRAQLLRSEQEKELMRTTLADMAAKREAALTEAKLARKHAAALQRSSAAGGAAAGGGSARKPGRRDTWCPGDASWAAPAQPLAGACELPPVFCHRSPPLPSPLPPPAAGASADRRRPRTHFQPLLPRRQEAAAPPRRLHRRAARL